jgi:uncharacterized membrane protein YccC
MTMATDPGTRASDADRDRIADALREHYAAGRLSLEEFGDRLDLAYAARTLGDLDALMADLPAVDLGQLPAALLRAGSSPRPARPGSPGPVEPTGGRRSPAWRAAWGSWLAISLCAFMIWLLSGANGGPWFLWVALPIGALLLGRWVTGGPAPRGQHRDRRHRGR